jgi:TonB family protein
MFLCRVAHRAVFTFGLCAALAAPTFAQQAELDTLATKVAQRIAQQNKKVVVVVDFTLARIGEHALGAAVAKEFLASLRRVAPELKFIDQQMLQQSAQKLNFLPMDLTNPLAVPAMALAAGAEASVVGVISTDAKKRTTLGIHITDLQAEGDPFVPRVGVEFGTIQAPLSLTPEWENLRKQPAVDQENGVYRVRAANGMTRPECAKCPAADYTKLARARGTEGIVSLLVTVTVQGETRDIAVLKQMKDGLSESAVEAVRQWKFKPARRRDGTTVPARVKIDVTFRMEQ